MYDLERVLSGGHLVVHEPESSSLADEAGYSAWLRAKSVLHNPSILAGLYTFRLSDVHVAWIALVGHMGQGFLMALSANELRIILTHSLTPQPDITTTSHPLLLCLLCMLKPTPTKKHTHPTPKKSDV